MVAEKTYRCREIGGVEPVMGTGIDHELDRNALTFLPRDAVVVTAVNHIAALIGERPVVELADQDQRRHSHVVLESKARRIEGDCRAKLVLRGLFEDAVLDRRESEPAALREADPRDPAR